MPQPEQHAQVSTTDPAHSTQRLRLFSRCTSIFFSWQDGQIELSGRRLSALDHAAATVVSTSCRRGPRAC